MRRLTTNSSVKNIARNGQTKERDIKPNTIKNRKHIKIISQNGKRFFKATITGDRFRIIK